VLFGRFNAGTCVLASDQGHDTISDFDATNELERIDLQALSASQGLTLASLQLDQANAGRAQQVGTDVVIDTSGASGPASSITVQGVSLADLDAADFLF